MNLYDVLAGQCTTHFERLFSRRFAGSWKVSELTGTLPITFRSNGANLENYRIYGTAEGAGETKNNINYTDIDATMYGIHCYWENDGVHVEGTYSETTAKAPAPFRRYCYLEAGTYILSGSTDYTTTGFRLQIGTCSDDSGSDYTPLGYDNGSGYTFTLQDASYVGVRIYIAAAASGQQIDAVMPIMLRKADTTPDFEPFGYKISLSVTSGTQTKDIGVLIGDAKLMAGDYIDYKSGKIYKAGGTEITIDLPAIETFNGENTLDSTETVGEVTIKGQIKPQS